MLKNFIIMCVVLVAAIILYNVLTAKGVELCFDMNDTRYCLN